MTSFQLSGRRVVLALLSLAVTGAFAQSAPAPKTSAAPVKVDSAWVRPAAQGQLGTGGFMNLTASTSMQLVGVSTPAADVAEVHEMHMEGDIMRMRAVPVLDLPAGKTVQLKPGGYHLMLMELNQPLPNGSTMPLTLRFKDAKGLETQLEIKVPVSLSAPGAKAAAGAHAHGKH